jgi:cell division protein FtsN
MKKNCVSALLIASALVVAGPFINNVKAGIVDDVIVDYRLGLYDDAFNRMLHVADDRHPRALFWVGSMYQKGRGTAVDFERANEFYRRAALLGNSDAQNNLGLMYRYGTGVQQDRKKAFAWFSIAASNGNRIAADNRDRLGFMRRDPQRVRAQVFVVQFRRDIRTYQSAVMEPVKDVRELPEIAIVRSKADEESEPVIEQSAPLKNAVAVEPGSLTVEDHATPSRVVPSATPVQETSFEQTSPEASLGSSSPSSFQLAATPETMPQTRGRPMKTVATNVAFTVQVGIFAKKQSAQRIQEAAARTGIELREDQIVISDRFYSRIRHGKFVNITEAKYAADQINGLFKVESLIVRTIN